ncbi:MAG: Fe3+-complex ABC transporter substrate-binding protein [Candidatus Desulfovibrio kirbyi]|uniref:Fe3+-complex ABC transporter substrate-binding protein n=1 Tax=Candidatus Desulfovibrio kirbyi TaxID=2696086 RepID=A0A6L2R7D1_9BACT|nr:MAG: Fe3+-complex ABC transporter substrate-binding protein [Candidatus Desulfovibrio kirbyi]
MPKILLTFLLCWVAQAWLPAPAGAAPITVCDDTGVTITLQAPAKRIIPLYGAYSELLLALDAGSLLVARTAADTHLAPLSALPAIGTHMRPNAELIVAQKPDLILQFAGRREASIQTEALRALGLNVLTFSLNSFEDIFSVLETLGRLTAHEAKAKILRREWQARLVALHDRYGGQKPVRVFYEVRYPNLLAAGADGIVNEIISAAGGENVVREQKKLVRVNEESLIVADPDVYLVQKGPMNPDPDALTARPHFRNLRAVRAGRVVEVAEQRFARPGPGALEAAEDLGRILHP